MGISEKAWVSSLRLEGVGRVMVLVSTFSSAKMSAPFFDTTLRWMTHGMVDFRKVLAIRGNVFELLHQLPLPCFSRR